MLCVSASCEATSQPGCAAEWVGGSRARTFLPPPQPTTTTTPPQHTLIHLPASRTRSCIPSPLCYEAGLVYVQGVLLVSRTLLTEYVAFLEGRIGRWVA